MGELNRAKIELRKAETDYRAMDKKLVQAKAYIADRQFQLERLIGETRKAQTANRYNRLVDEINAIQLELSPSSSSAMKRRRKTSRATKAPRWRTST